MRKRLWKLNVYLSLEERQMLRIKAEKTGLTRSELIRSLITGFEPKEKPTEEFYKDIDSIRKVGNILNQIAKRTNYLGYIEDTKFLRDMSRELDNLIVNIKRKYLLPAEK